MYETHRVHFDETNIEEHMLVELGFSKKRTINITTKDKQWKNIKSLIEKFKPDDSYRTIYEKKDIENSKWLQLWLPTFCFPAQDTFEFPYETYDKTRWCNKCGIEKIQSNPFKLRKNPTQTTKDFFTIEWTFDQIFLKISTYEAIFRPLNVGYVEVLDKKGNVIQDWVQLKIETFVDIDISKRSFTLCEECGNKKYDPFFQSEFPAIIDKIDTDIHIVKTKQYFGGGIQAIQWILISNELFKKIDSIRNRGIYYVPVLNI